MMGTEQGKLAVVDRQWNGRRGGSEVPGVP